MLTCAIPSLSLFRRGKVRDIYFLDRGLLFIATDRISAFDAILPEGIPDKGRVLNGLSVFWFEKTTDIVRNHFTTARLAEMPLPDDADQSQLEGRSMFVRKVEIIPFECVVRDYLVGSAWREYQEHGTVCGSKLPAGMQLADQFSEPLFTPSTKAEQGHDQNVSFEYMANKLGKMLATRIKQVSLDLFCFARKFLRDRKLILVDTKFEFGLEHGELVLVDEIFTPDSSRFWKLETYRPGTQQEGLDKEFVREFLRQAHWTGEGPPPHLPAEIIEKTRARYLHVFDLITKQHLEV